MNLDGLKKVVVKLIDVVVNRKARMGAETFLAGFEQDIKNAFDRGEDPTDGTQWPARTGNAPHKLLWKTGAMRGIAIATVQASQPSGWGVTVTLPGPGYAAGHIRGTARLPKRNFWGVSPATVGATAKQTKGEIVKIAVGG